MNRLLTAICMLVVFAASAALGWSVHVLYRLESSPTFELRRGEWECTDAVPSAASERLVGKVVATIQAHATCRRYERRKAPAP